MHIPYLNIGFSYPMQKRYKKSVDNISHHLSNFMFS